VELYRHLDEVPSGAQGGALTIGNFDGVHLGHALIVEQLQRHAAEFGGPAVIFTFDPHPVRILRPDQAPPPLTWTDRKADLFEELGVDVMVVYPTDETLLSLSPQDFFDRIVRDRLAARALVEGPNFYFGHGRTGNVQILEQMCHTAEIRLDIVEPLVAEDVYISSSRVRTLLRDGHVEAAGKLLTQPYRIRGMVTHGAARGAKLGFPTANIDAIDTLLPANGVYAGRAYVGDAVWPSAINIGPNPTFGEDGVKVEAHLIGFQGSLYGQPLEVDFLTQLRDIRPFESVEALIQQLGQDVEQARRIAGG
jgi:riboflavin kinase/FMN adenylyltransferase